MKSVLSLKLQDFLLCIFSAIFLILSFPNFNFWLFAWIGFLPLFFALEDKSKGKAFLLSYFTGVLFWFGVIYWLAYVTFWGMVLLVLYLALYFGFFGLIFKIYQLRVMSYKLLFIPCVWVILEYIRSRLFTGFPWALLAYSQYLNLPVIQIADLTGAWGVSFLVMLINITIYSAVRRKIKYISPILILLITVAYGYSKISRLPLSTDNSLLRISVIQGNIPQALKWELQTREFIMNRYFTLSAQANQDKPDLIIWPEAAVPVVLEEVPLYYEMVRNFAQELKTPLLLGALTSRNNLYYNSALLIPSKGEAVSRYDKLHLVPFGEYIPLKNIFPFLETVVPIGDFTAGKQYTIFKTANRELRTLNYFAVLICFEDLFAGLSRGFVKKGANCLVNITNDAWFGRSSSPYQHLSASVFRAVENRVPVVRAANTGVSGFIAASGKIISLVRDEEGKNIFIGGYATQEISLPKKYLTFYTRYGDIFILFCLLLVFYARIPLFKKMQ